MNDEKLIHRYEEMHHHSYKVSSICFIPSFEEVKFKMKSFRERDNNTKFVYTFINWKRNKIKFRELLGEELLEEKI